MLFVVSGLVAAAILLVGLRFTGTLLSSMLLMLRCMQGPQLVWSMPYSCWRQIRLAHYQ
jgi:hypothetical protein